MLKLKAVERWWTKNVQRMSTYSEPASTIRNNASVVIREREASMTERYALHFCVEHFEEGVWISLQMFHVALGGN